MGKSLVTLKAWRVSAVPVPVLNVPSADPSTSRGPSLKTSRFCAAITAVATTLV